MLNAVSKLAVRNVGTVRILDFMLAAFRMQRHEEAEFSLHTTFYTSGIQPLLFAYPQM
jgi:hypothetical protein